MMKIYFFLLSIWIAIGAAAQTPVPSTFSQRAAIVLSGPGPYHRLTLPLAVYQGVQRADLGDLRVFNGRGEPVPYALLRSTSTTARVVEEKPVPLFPIVSKKGGQGSDGDLSLELRRSADGTLIALRQSPAIAGTDRQVRGVIVDASQQGKGLRLLRLTVGPSSTPFHAYSIETSDDLQQWRMLKADAQLVQLEHDGRRIERNTAEWTEDAGKYLRILWSEPQQAPEIREVTVGTVRTSVEQPPAVWSSEMLPVATDKNAYEYALPGHLPLELLRINLPEQNTLVPLAIQRRLTYRRHQHEETSWQTIASTVVYRLQSPQGEMRSSDIILNLPGENRLRLSIDARGSGLGKAPPSLQVGFVPHSLVFLARGEGPFTLAWGASGVDIAALPMSTLMPGYSDERTLSASPAEVQAAFTAAPAVATANGETSAPLSKGALWAILIGGVSVLGGMVWALLRQMKRETN
jgi:hypothetical protein